MSTDLNLVIVAAHVKCECGRKTEVRVNDVLEGLSSLERGAERERALAGDALDKCREDFQHLLNGVGDAIGARCDKPKKLLACVRGFALAYKGANEQIRDEVKLREQAESARDAALALLDVLKVCETCAGSGSMTVDVSGGGGPEEEDICAECDGDGVSARYKVQAALAPRPELEGGGSDA